MESCKKWRQKLELIIGAGILFVAALAYLFAGLKMWLKNIDKIEEQNVDAVIRSMPILMMGWPFFVRRLKQSYREKQTIGLQ